MTILDYVITAGILLWLIAAVRYIIRQKKAGRSTCSGSTCCGSTCSGSCSGCRKY